MTARLSVTQMVMAFVLSLGLAGCQTSGRVPAAAISPQTGLDAKADERAHGLYLSVIGQLIENEMYHAALAHLDEFEHRYGMTATSHRLRGDAWLALGAFDDAEREYETIAQGPLAGFGSHGLGRVAAARENWTLASIYFERAARVQPTNIGFLNDFGCALYRLGRFDDAKFQLEKAAELSPSDLEVSVNLKTVLALAERRDMPTQSAGNSEAAQSEDAP